MLRNTETESVPGDGIQGPTRSTIGPAGQVCTPIEATAAAESSAELLSATSPHLRSRITSAMRWTLWLSLLGAPFSYGATVLLARVGTEAVGTYGLLMVYRGLVASFFYFGGDSVVYQFIPGLKPEKKPAFLMSYLLVVCAGLVPWLVAASLWPHGVSYIFGRQVSQSFEIAVLYLSPIYLVFALVVAALKAELEMRWAQTLLRLLTFDTFLVYAALFFLSRNFLEAHYTGLIWGTYLGFCGLGFVMGLWHLQRLDGWRFRRGSLGFFLPSGFWKYAISVQEQSSLGFLLRRLDLILVLNFGSLSLLGEYVAIITLAQLIEMGNRFFLDTLLPSLTNVLAIRNYDGASQVTSLNMRILLIVTLAETCGLMFFIGPLIGLLGPHYTFLKRDFVLAIVLCGVAQPGAIGATLLTSIGKQQRAVWISIGQIALFTALFSLLWPRWQLEGAILASGLSLCAASLSVIVAARHAVPFNFSFARDYACFAFVTLVSAAVAIRLDSQSVPVAAAAFVGTLLLFSLAARYSLAEYEGMVRCFLPSRLGALR